MQKRLIHGLLILTCLLLYAAGAVAAEAPRFEISYSAEAHPGPITGRLFLILADKEQPEPRLTVSPSGPAIFGVDIEQLPPEQAAVVDSSTLGSPRRSLADLPPGEYFAQALIHIYTQVRRADGHTLWVHMNDGQFTYGRPMKGHSWHAWTWAGMVEEIAEYIKNNAPPGENTAAWNY